MNTFAIAGCGHLGKIVCKAYKEGLLNGYKLVAAYSRKKEDAEALIEGTEGAAGGAGGQDRALQGFCN